MGTRIDRRDALVLAHYYAPDAVQAQADFVGDSFALAQKAVKSDKPVIVFCGVSFMGESAKILCPQKTVYLPAPDAHCAMADMATEEEILHIRREVDDLAVVVYVNSSARLKAHAARFSPPGKLNSFLYVYFKINNTNRIFGFRLFSLDAYIPSNGPLDRIFFTSWTNASPVPQSKWVNAPVPPPAPMADTCTVPPCPTNVKVRLARLALRIK